MTDTTFTTNVTVIEADWLNDVNATTYSIVNIKHHGAIGDGVTDDSAAFASAKASIGSAGGVIHFPMGNYLIDEIVLPTKVSIIGAGRHFTRAIITGDGGGAPGQASNGGIQAFLGFNEFKDITLSYNNASLQGLLNISQSGATAISRTHLENVDLAIESSLAATDIDCIAVYLANHVEFTWVNGQIGIFPNFKQDIVIRGFWNGCSVKGVTFRPHAEDLNNSVYHSINPLLDINASTHASKFDNCTFEQGPNFTKIAEQGSVSFTSCYYGDGDQAANLWLPSTVLSLGDFIYPSATITGDAAAASADLLNVSATTNLYTGQKIVVMGAGAAGAILDTRIIDIVGTTVTMADAASTTAATTGIYYPDYSGHGYMVVTAGTSGASAPSFPTASGSTVADNTITLKEYGPCAVFDFNTAGSLIAKSDTSIDDCYVAANVVGVCAIRTGAAPGVINIQGGHWQDLDIAGHFDGVSATYIAGVNLDGYNAYGFLYSGASGSCRDNMIGPLYSHNVTNGADVVVNEITNNLGGLVVGNLITTGLGKDRYFSRIETLNPDPTARFNGRIEIETGILWVSGTNTPEGSVTAPVGSFYSRTNGGASTSWYVKESGTGNTGWVAK